MRIVFILLLFANLGFFVWENRLVQTPVNTFVAVDPGVPQLELLSDITDNSNSDIPLVDNNSDAVNQQCFSVGPFLDESELQPAVELLNPLVLKTRIRKMTTTQEAGYWVYLPALANRSEALSAGRKLAAANVRDYYVVTSGNHENTVSLGLYRQQYNADNRIAELQTKGFEVKKEVRLEQWPEFWLNYAVTQDQLAGIPDLSINNPDLQQNNVRCEN